MGNTQTNQRPTVKDGLGAFLHPYCTGMAVRTAPVPSVRQGQTGFTLIELIVTMAIAAILLTVGVPSFSTVIKNNRLVSQTNSLVTDLNIARSEAVKRATSVVLCNSSNPNAAAPTCSGSGNNWSSGWLVFVDANTNSTFDGTDTLIKVGQAIDGSAAVRATAGLNTFTYAADGTNASAAVADFAICDDRGEDFGRQVRISTTGRPRLITGSSTSPLSSCTAPT